MPALPNGRRERFCSEVAKGKSQSDAYRIAGYSGNIKNASTLRKQPDIDARINEILAKRQSIEYASTQRAIERIAMSKEALAREWLPLASSNMRNYVGFDIDDNAYFDLRFVTEDQWKAVKALQIDEKVKDGAVIGRKTKIWLHDKLTAGRQLAELFQWIERARPEPPTPLEQRLRAMTPDQREENAREFVRRVEQRLLEAEANGEVTDGGIGNVAGVEPTVDTTDEEPEDGGA